MKIVFFRAVAYTDDTRENLSTKDIGRLACIELQSGILHELADDGGVLKVVSRGEQKEEF